MPPLLHRIRRQLRRAEARFAARRRLSRDLSRYRDDVPGYAADVLAVELTPVQQDICRLLRTPPYRVLVKSGHNVGKTFVQAVLCGHHFDTGGPGSVCITTAPTARDVRDLLWAEVRMQRAKAGLPPPRGETLPELYAGPDHYAKGYTTDKGESFQGRHHRRMLFLLDEAVGVRGQFWQTIKTMFQPTGEHGIVATFNPTDTSSQPYQEEMAGGWHVVQMASHEHPNIAAQLAGRPPVHPGAVTLAQFESWLADWSDEIGPGDADALDLEWPPGSGRWHRCGPLMECRALGRWPSAGSFGVWSDALWQQAARAQPEDYDPRTLPVLGCDVARQGENYTALHGRWGRTSWHHERHNGWTTDRTAGRLRQLCADAAALANRHRPAGSAPARAEEVPVNIDADGIGGGVLDQAGGYRWFGVHGMGAPVNPRDHFNTRTELWFSAAARARRGRVDVSRLAPEHRQLLRTQLLAPRWKVNAAGQCQVERKEETVARLQGGASPDDADAFNLAFREPPRGGSPFVDVKEPKQSRAERRGLFGRGDGR
jgi:hypothetical protein